MLIYISLLMCLITPSMSIGRGILSYTGSESKLCTLDRCRNDMRKDEIIWRNYYGSGDTVPASVQLFRFKEDGYYHCALHLENCVTGSCSCAPSVGTAVLVNELDGSWTVHCDTSFNTFTQAERRTIDYSSGNSAPVLSADGSVSGDPVPSSADDLYNEIRVAQQQPRTPAPIQAPTTATPPTGNVYQQAADEFTNLEMAMEDTQSKTNTRTIKTTTISTTTRAPVTPVEVSRSTATTTTKTTTTTTTAKVVSQEQSTTEKTDNTGNSGKQAGETGEYDELGSLQTKYYVVVAFVIIFVFILIIIAVVLFMKMKQSRAGHAMISPGPDQEPLTPSGTGGAFTFDGKTPR